jgi:starch synthase
VLKILFVCSEAVPFCKTGGLADVTGALAKVLHQHGHDVRMVLPRYQVINQGNFRLLPIMPEIKVRFGPNLFNGSVLRTSYPDTQMPVYFIDEPGLFARSGLYGTGHSDYIDNDSRFAFFSMAVLWMLRALDWQPDVIHIHDWQVGLLAALLKHHPEVLEDPFFKEIKTVFSIHNLAYQGNFDKFLVPAIGLPWDVFTTKGLEFFGKASYLKSGLMYSDELVAVSPTYSKEIQEDANGAGMAGTLRSRSANLHGILNGIDTEVWNPRVDKVIPHRYNEKFLEGKAQCKAQLQSMAGFPQDPKVPLVGLISRLVAAKGFDLVSKSIEELIALKAQFIILGSGESMFEEMFLKASKKHPDQFAARIGYDEPLAHQIIAASDIFLMPSFYEPCGLTQLYAMAYGTIPVVRRTGGLADSVTPATPESIKDGTATGFQFDEYRESAMVLALSQAIELFKGNKKGWKKLLLNCLRHDFSWSESALKYEPLYEQVINPSQSEGID